LTENHGTRAQSLVKVTSGAIDPLRLFSALSDEGRAPRAVLLESADIHTHNAKLSLGCADPCVRITCTGRDWELLAFNLTGRKVLSAVLPHLSFCADVKSTEDSISGRLPAPEKGLEERERLSVPGPMDLLRAVHLAVGPVESSRFPPGGLLGAFAYDLVDCCEELPSRQTDQYPAPDMVFYLADHLFLVDHIHDRCVFVATALNVSGPEEEYNRAQGLIRLYEKIANNSAPLPDLPSPPSLAPHEVAVDLDDSQYAGVVQDLKEHILDGDVFQIVPSRTFTAPCTEEPLAVYRRLRKLNPSPYMFYVRMEGQTLLAASPETALKVSADGKVEIRPIAGTRPRGLIEGKLDVDLDGRFEAELKLDTKELAEHVMLVDLARNDVARVSKPGTRQVPRLFEVEKYSHVQHLVSCVTGQLKEGLDPLHAYLATMNMGTLTGAPKVEAMRLLRETEATRRGFYGGAVGYYMLNGDFDSAIVIRSLLLTGDTAIARAGAGVVYDSVPEAEAEETRSKARAPLAALGFEEGR